MSAESERKLLLVLIKNIWLPQFGLMSYPNVDFTTPNNTQWAAVKINEYGRERASLGRNDFLRKSHGSLQIDLYCPKDIGSSENKIISDWLENYFEDLVLTCEDGDIIEFSTPSSHDSSGVQERQEGTNDNWYRRIFDAPFTRKSNVVKP